MLNVFSALIEVLQTFTHFVLNIVHGLQSLIGAIPQSSQMITTMLSYIPAEVSAFGVVTIFIIIVLFIVGR